MYINVYLYDIFKIAWKDGTSNKNQHLEHLWPISYGHDSWRLCDIHVDDEILEIALSRLSKKSADIVGLQRDNQWSKYEIADNIISY